MTIFHFITLPGSNLDFVFVTDICTHVNMYILRYWTKILTIFHLITLPGSNSDKNNDHISFHYITWLNIITIFMVGYM